MKLSIEMESMTTESLNKTLKGLSGVLNNDLVASGNKVSLVEQEDNYGGIPRKCKHFWQVNVSVEWVKVPTGRPD